MDRKEKAMDLFFNGFNCAQSVLAVFAEKYGLKPESALKISTGFGAGMASMQKTCGAVTGAYMTIGLMSGKYKKEDEHLRDKTYKHIENFNKFFIENFKSTDCISIIKTDLKTDEGKKEFHNDNLKEKICAECIKKSIEYLESIGC